MVPVLIVRFFWLIVAAASTGALGFSWAAHGRLFSCGPVPTILEGKKMQVGDQVKVLAAGGYEGKAGVIIRIDTVTQVATVKLDEVEMPQGFAAVELEHLGR